MKQALSGRFAATGRGNEGAQAMRVVSSDDPSSLMRVHEPSVNLVVWRRTPDDSVLAAWRDACPAGSTVVDGIVRPGALHEAVEPACAPSVRERFGVFAQDVLVLSRWMASIAGCVEVRARLVSIDDDQCRLFHVDEPALRILSTYVGPGTQWVEEGGARRERLGMGGLPADAFNRALLLPGAAVHQARTGWVCLQKGDAYPGNRGRAIVHRSPPIEGTGLRRLRLTLEPAGYCRYGPP
jgi:hypothetical protein